MSKCKLSTGAKLIILGVLLVVIDQIIKILVKTNMSLGESFCVIGQWFRISFIENEGMAFGFRFGGTIGKLFLTLFRIVLFGGLCWWIRKLIQQAAPTGVLVGLTLITAGAFGNIVDSVLYGQLFSESAPGVVATFGGEPYAPFFFGRVVDMFYFPLIDTVWPSWMPWVGGRPFQFFEPVFNFADSCVTVGAFYLILFQYKFFSKGEEK